MNTVIQTSTPRKGNLLFIVGTCLCLYFSFHLLFGERGYLKLVHLSHDYQISSLEYGKLKEEREALEKKVIGMRTGSIDLDLLEERVQVMLGVLPENTFVLTR